MPAALGLTLGELVSLIVTTGTTVYAAENSASTSRHNADAARQASVDAATKQAADAKKRDAENAGAEQSAKVAQINAAIAAKQSQAVPGLSPDFLTQEVQQEFPVDGDLVKQIMSGMNLGGK